MEPEIKEIEEYIKSSEELRDNLDIILKAFKETNIKIKIAASVLLLLFLADMYKNKNELKNKIIRD